MPVLYERARTFVGSGVGALVGKAVGSVVGMLVGWPVGACNHRSEGQDTRISPLNKFHQWLRCASLQGSAAL